MIVHTTKHQAERQEKSDSMNWEKELNSLKKIIETRLEKEYESFQNEDEKWFVISEKCFVHIDMMMGKGFNCILPEFVDSMESLCIAEDGNLYYPEDFQSDEELIKKCLDDIKSEA